MNVGSTSHSMASLLAAQQTRQAQTNRTVTPAQEEQRESPAERAREASKGSVIDTHA